MSIQGISQYGSIYNAYPARVNPVQAVEKTGGQQHSTEIQHSAKIQHSAESQHNAESQHSTESQHNAESQHSTEIQSIQNASTGDNWFETSDVMKAVADMQKDSVLQQYQTFVGEGRVVYSSEDGIVIMK